MQRRKKSKLLEIIVLITGLSILYVIFKKDIYTWSCNQEGTNSACYIVGLINDEEGDPEQARIWYEKSCELKYELACHKINRKLLKK